MASKLTRPVTNGSALRRCPSWIDRFTELTANTEAPKVFRKWAGISTVAAALEQKVWIDTTSKFYPNLYVALVGQPAIGKTRTITKGLKYLEDLRDFKIGPTDMTKASLVDSLFAAKRHFVLHKPDVNDEFNSMTLFFDEWGVFLTQFEGDIIPALTTFYDSDVAYRQARRHLNDQIEIKRPQLNILAGTTPSNLMKFMPSYAWDQGFTSRLIMVYSTERNKVNDFARTATGEDDNLKHDIQNIFQLYGEMKETKEFEGLVWTWRNEQDENPKPSHPKLAHYNARRKGHLYKLAMVASADEGEEKALHARHFHRALGWLQEIEVMMPEVFAAGDISADGKSMDEIVNYVQKQGKPITEGKIIRYACGILPAYSIEKVFKMMVLSGRIKKVGDDAYISPPEE